jgi:hypothetical protein
MPEQNEALMRLITQEEVDQAVKEMPLGKAPCTDAFITKFFHYCWPMMREEVWQLIDDSRSSGQVLLAFNATFLTLISKEEWVSHPKKFCPITLCNIIYKIITKVITLRLKPVLPFLISKELSWYVKGRQIMNNTILAHKVIHSLKSTQTPGMLIKLDLSKALDRISWKYMCSLLEAFDFEKAWIDWIMKLTSSTFFSILVNGVPSQPFPCTKGIHQGDPLSPILFVIMAESLGCYINALVENGSLKGLPLHNLQPTTSHSQFVHDTLLMKTPITQEAKNSRPFS